jgi:hypothetical protein
MFAGFGGWVRGKNVRWRLLARSGEERTEMGMHVESLGELLRCRGCAEYSL